MQYARSVLHRWLWLLAATTLWSTQEAYAQRPGTDGVEAEIHVLGRAVYDKIPVTSSGLTPDARWQEPIRGAVVEVFDASSGILLRTTATDDDGWFLAGVPRSANYYTVRVLSALAGDGISVADNARGNRLWAVSGGARPGEAVTLRASDETRVAGAFNILDVIRRANRLVGVLEENMEIPELTVFWSPLNSSDPTRAPAFANGTWFDADRNRAVVLGDRGYDSDEFDDDVILHEYAHFLAAHFSAADSLGGPHGPGDILDPRVAWSEGWANFFSALVDGDPVYRDSRAWAESEVLEYDLESNFQAGTQPGYWSEQSVHALLWDLTDDGEDFGEQVTLGLPSVWEAFKRLAGDPFVYLPSFLDALVDGGTLTNSEVEQLARLHFLDYVAGGAAPVGSFPRAMEGDVVTGELDSWSDARTNLAKSAHLYAFHTSGGAVTIDLAVTGPGAARNLIANDLELRLMDGEGRVLRISNEGGDGESERIATFLPRGEYVVEIRSFFTRPDQQRDMNSASYRMTVNRP